MRLLASILTVTMLATLLPPAVQAEVRYIRCESGGWGGRYRSCPAETQGRVELVRELSRGRCYQWDSWGYDRNGVWVDNGCRAEFRVGKDGGGMSGGQTAAVVGAVAGAAVIAAIIAGKHGSDKGSDGAQAPNWARGEFRGFSPKFDADYTVNIAANGDVTGQANGDRLTGHVAKGNRLHLGDVEFDLKQASWGFTATQRDDRDHVIVFRRR